jgi:hypothetical protein
MNYSSAQHQLCQVLVLDFGKIIIPFTFVKGESLWALMPH